MKSRSSLRLIKQNIIVPVRKKVLKLLLLIIKRKPFQGFNWENAAHLLYVLSFMLYALRFMEFFKMSKSMGPKVVMIFSMFIDLVFFVLLLLLFVFCYSIGIQVTPFKHYSSPIIVPLQSHYSPALVPL